MLTWNLGLWWIGSCCYCFQDIDKAAVEFELGSNRAFDRFAVAEHAVDEEDSEMPDIVAQDHIQTQSDVESGM